MTSDPVERFLERTRLERSVMELGPMPTAQLIGSAIQRYRHCWSALLSSSVCPSLCIVAAWAFLTQYLAPRLVQTGQRYSPTAQVVDALQAGFVGLGLAVPLLLVGLLWQSISSSYTASRAFPMHSPAHQAHPKGSAIETILFGFQQFVATFSGLIGSALSSLVTGVLAERTDALSVWPIVTAGIAVVLLLVGLVQAAGMVAVHALAPLIFIFEKQDLRGSALRSRQLMVSTHFHPSGFWLVVTLTAFVGFSGLVVWYGWEVMYTITGLRAGIEGTLQGYALQQAVLLAFDFLPEFIVIWLLGPLWTMGLTVIYQDRRNRLEGQDIEELAQISR